MTGMAYPADWPRRRRGSRDRKEWIAAMGRGSHGWHGGPWEFFGGGPRGGWGGPWGPPGGRRGPKARRGDVRAAILGVLADEPMNGYQIIQEFAQRSGGVWRPSPGSIYPTLQQLEDEGLVQAEADGGRRVFRLTEAGRAYVAEHADEVAAPWRAMSESAEASSDDVRPLIGQVAAAVWQVYSTGSPEQRERAREALADVRRRLYGILADGDEGDGGDRT